MAHALDIDAPQTLTGQQRFVNLKNLPTIYRQSLRVINYCHNCQNETRFYVVDKTRRYISLQITNATNDITQAVLLGKDVKFCSVCGWCSNNRRAKLGALREQIYILDRYECVYCGRAPGKTSLSLDHIIPISKGGTDAAFNLVTACQPCNVLKSNGEAPPMVGGRYRTKRWILRRATCNNLGIEDLGCLSRYTRDHLTLNGQHTLCKRNVPRRIDWACVSGNCKNCEKALVRLFIAGQLPLFDTSQLVGKWREFVAELK